MCLCLRSSALRRLSYDEVEKDPSVGLKVNALEENSLTSHGENEGMTAVATKIVERWK